jgi:hypothetical protein
MGIARIARAALAAGTDQARLAPHEVERIGAGFIRPQKDKPECESDNEDEEHRMNETLPGFGASAAMIAVQFISPGMLGGVEGVAAGRMRPRGSASKKQ